MRCPQWACVPVGLWLRSRPVVAVEGPKATRKPDGPGRNGPQTEPAQWRDGGDARRLERSHSLPSALRGAVDQTREPKTSTLPLLNVIDEQTKAVRPRGSLISIIKASHWVGRGALSLPGESITLRRDRVKVLGSLVWSTAGADQAWRKTAEGACPVGESEGRHNQEARAFAVPQLAQGRPAAAVGCRLRAPPPPSCR
jgi:hypothetical protein